MPGRGESSGKGFANGGGKEYRTRSDRALDEGGPADLVEALITSLWLSGKGEKKKKEKVKAKKVDRVVLIGSDWGGGIAHVMAASKAHRGLISKVVTVHPSLGSLPPSTFLPTDVPTLVIWCKQDRASLCFALFWKGPNCN